jgi:uncharacterized protein YcgI (DUF1989 family)
MTMNEVVVPGAHGKATRVREGQFVSIIDVYGSQVADLLAFVGDGPAEFLSTTHSASSTSKVLWTTGDTLYSNRRRPVLEFVYDDCGRHDMHYAMCDPERYEYDFGVTDHRSCMQNFLEAFAEAGLQLRREQLPNPLNLNQNSRFDLDGNLEQQPSLSKAGGRVTLRALADLLVGVSACPQDLNPINGGVSTDLLLRVTEKAEEAAQ